MHAVPAMTKAVVDARNGRLGNQLLYKQKLQSGLEKGLAKLNVE